jgi:hypothetical protein
MDRVMSVEPPPDKELAGLARAFCDLEETKRKLKMKPLPKAVDVEKYRKPRTPKPTAGFTES